MYLKSNLSFENLKVLKLLLFRVKSLVVKIGYTIMYDKTNKVYEIKL